MASSAREAGSGPLRHDISRDLGIEIIEGAWRTDQVITLEEIQNRFGVSRTVAREVTRSLESKGMVTSRRSIGISPQPIEAWKVLDADLIDWRLKSQRRGEQLRTLTQLRMAVEPAAAFGMAMHESVHVRASLLPVAAEMRRTGEAGDLEEYLEHDTEFHRLVLRSSGNELFAALADLVAVVLRGRLEAGLMPERPAEESIAAHEEVAQEMFRGDPEGARRSMERVIQEVRGAIGDAGPPASDA